MAVHRYKCFSSRLAAPFRQLYGTSLNVYLHFSSRDENLGIPAVTLAYVWLLLLASAQSESFGSIDPETGVCANFVDY